MNIGTVFARSDAAVTKSFMPVPRTASDRANMVPGTFSRKKCTIFNFKYWYLYTYSREYGTGLDFWTDLLNHNEPQ